jgi:hypothetical protein
MFFRFHQVDALQRVNVVVPMHAKSIVLAAATSVEDLQMCDLEFFTDFEQFRCYCRIDN